MVDAERRRRLVALARLEAASLHDPFIGTEHILLALARTVAGTEDERRIGAEAGLATRILHERGVEYERVRHEVARRRPPPRAPSNTLRELPFTPHAKDSLEIAAEEAYALAAPIGSEHLLLGLLRVTGGVAGEVLALLGLTRASTLARIEELAPPTRSLFDRLASRTRRVLVFARREAARGGRTSVVLGDLVAGVLREGTGAAASVLDELKLVRGSSPGRSGPLPRGKLRRVMLSPVARDVLGAADEAARESERHPIEPEHLVIAMLRLSGSTELGPLRDLSDEKRSELVERLVKAAG
jgi:ATP-dependent Clp protease ATP-binding subunit ClpA